MASERDLELLDDYISNRLNAQAKSAFEERLQADPELKGEFQLQNKIAEGLRNARKAELKAMLVAIPTAGLSGGEGSQMSIPAKIGVWVAATAVVGTGIYFFLTSNQTTDQPAKNHVIEMPKQAPEQVPADSQLAESTAVAPDNTQNESPSTEETVAVAPKVESSRKKKEDTSTVQPAGKPSIEAFDPSVSESTPEGTINQAELQNFSNPVTGDIPVLNDNTSKKYRFHYQIKDGKLTLFGPFEKSLYELIAFYDGESPNAKVTRFLYHASKYYLLKDDDDKVKALTPITDPKLIGKLNESRQK